MRSVGLIEASRVGVHSLICPLIEISRTGIKGLQEYIEFYSITHLIQCFMSGLTTKSYLCLCWIALSAGNAQPAAPVS